MGDTWSNLRRELQRIHLGYVHGTVDRVRRRTEITLRQREMLTVADVPEPPQFRAIDLPLPPEAAW